MTTSEEVRTPPAILPGRDRTAAHFGKVLRDPVHNLISFDGADLPLLRVIDCPEVQRLRWIRQLGVCFLAYPGTEHSRFSHSIGVYHVMKRLLTTLMPLSQEAMRSPRGLAPELAIDSLDGSLAMAAKLYALLHDVGHGPFSHLFERAFDPQGHLGPPLHERWSLRLVTDPESTLASTIRQQLGGEVHELLVELMSHRHGATYLSSLVSSQLDADRFDYLMRDNLASGTTYGFYDLDWILRSLRLVLHPRGEWVVAVDGRKGLYAIEQYLLARRNMYQQVYLHKTTRMAETLVLCVLERLRALVLTDTAACLHRGVPQGLVDLAVGGQPRVGDYLELDDATLWHLFKGWARSEQHSGDRVLTDLCRRLVGRELFKTIELSPFEAQELAEGAPRWVAIEERVAQCIGVPVELAKYYVRLDTVETQPYDEGDERIWLTFGDGGAEPPLLALDEHPQMGGAALSAVSAPTRIILAREARRPVTELVRGAL